MLCGQSTRPSSTTTRIKTNIATLLILTEIVYETIVHYNKGLSLFDSSYVFYYRWRFSAKCIEQLIQSKKDIQILTKD